MRSIIFRAKTIGLDDRRWVAGDLHLYSKAPHIHSGPFKHPIDVSTVGEFTGLKDKNDTMVYEGDILRVREYENLLMKEFPTDEEYDIFTLEEIRGKLLKEYVSPVIFEEGGFQVSAGCDYYDMWLASLFGDMKRCYPSFDFEVIGNIHDNPELIRKELKK